MGINIPIVVGGTLFAGLAVQYIQGLKAPELTPQDFEEGLQDLVDEANENLPEGVELPAVPKLSEKLPALPEFPEIELDPALSVFLVPVIAATIVYLANIGILGTAAGQIIKAAYDVWNGFAAV